MTWKTLLSCTLLAGCTPQPSGRIAAYPPAPSATPGALHPWMTPEQAVMLAAGSPDGIAGTFRLAVRAAGRQDGNLYLNSERDYRDPRNISIDIADTLAAAMAMRFGMPVERLVGRSILVTGTARKTYISFNVGGRPTGKYYYQTHIRLSDPRQLRVLDDAATR